MNFILAIASLIPGEPEAKIAVLAGLTAFAAVFAVWYALLEPRPMRVRLRGLENRRAQLRGDRASSRAQHPMRAQVFGVANEVVRRLRLLQSAQVTKNTESLQQAGWRSKDAIVLFMFFKFSLPFAFGAVAVLMLYVLKLTAMSDFLRLFVSVMAVLAGSFAPNIFVSNIATKRRKKITKGMPDGLDLMVICAEAGLSLDATLDRVGRELRGSWPEFADEISLTGIELGFLPDRRQALENLIKRVPLSGIRGLANTFIQTERYGTPLAQALRVLASELRVTRLMKAEEKAARLPAIMTIPMILFILPTLFIVLIGPAALDIIDSLSGLGYM